jgi:hypothetical protein
LVVREEQACEGDERTGVQVLKRGLEAPTRQIAENSAIDAGVAVARMLSGEGNLGFDAARKDYVDLVEAGIIDPTKVVPVALENAVSGASVLLLSEAIMTEIVEELWDVIGSSTPWRGVCSYSADAASINSLFSGGYGALVRLGLLRCLLSLGFKVGSDSSLLPRGAAKISPCKSPHARKVVLAHRRRHSRLDFAEVKMLQKVETRGAKDMRVLQGLHRLPVAALFERLERRGGNRHCDGLSAREEAAQGVGLEVIGKAV